MQQVDIDTTQNVALGYAIADVGRRSLAFAIDLLIQGAWLILFVSLGAATGVSSNAYWIVMVALPVVLYHLLLELLNNGQSVGKHVMKIRVVREDGTAPEATDYLVRWLFRLVDITISSGGVALITILLSRKAQRVGDLVAGTLVVQAASRQGAHIVPPAFDNDYQPRYPQVLNLTDVQVNEIRKILSQRKHTQSSAPIHILAGKVEQVLGVQRQGPPLVFLRQVVQDYQFMTSR